MANSLARVFGGGLGILAGCLHVLFSILGGGVIGRWAPEKRCDGEYCGKWSHADEDAAALPLDGISQA